MTRPLSRHAQIVIGVLREAGEHELESAIIAVRARIPKQHVVAAMSNLRSHDLIRTRREKGGMRRTFVSPNHQSRA